MRTVQLKDILTPDQLKAAWSIIRDNKDTTEQIAAMKAYFRTIEPDLTRQDIVPDYLAYAVINVAQDLGLGRFHV